MAKKNITDLFIPDGYSGKIGKQFVIRQYADKTEEICGSTIPLKLQKQANPD